VGENKQIEIYQTDDGQTQIQVCLDQDTLWLSQAQMAELFEKDSDTIGLHLRNIYKSGKLEKTATTEKSSVVRQGGAFLFIDFSHRNNRLLDENYQPVINETGLAALTLLVAESDPKQKDTLINDNEPFV